jgi:heterodisulfide reductase subunit A-like polyferredoxin
MYWRRRTVNTTNCCSSRGSYSFDGVFIEAAASNVPGLVLAGAPYRGVGIPDCVVQGRAAAARVLALDAPRSTAEASAA